MSEKAAPAGHGELNALVLRALVRKLVARGVLSPDDVRALLLDAAKGLDLVGSELTSEAARIIVEEDLAPAFLGQPRRSAIAGLARDAPRKSTEGA